MCKWKTILQLTLLLFPLLAGHCQKDPATILSEIQQLVAQGNNQKALKQITKQLELKNQELSQVLTQNGKITNIQGSLDGNLAAWLNQNNFYYISGSQDSEQKSIELPAPPYSFSLSYGGLYAAILFKHNQLCRLVLIDTRKKAKINHNIDDLPCHNQPLISDDGQILYFIKDNGIRYHKLNSSHSELQLEGNIAHPVEPENVLNTKFKKKFKNIKHHLYPYQIHEQGWLAFYGAAGYYTLYFYPGSGNKLISDDTVYARPVLHTVYDGDTLNLKSETEQEQIESMTQKQKAPDSYHFATALAFSYSGGAGKRKLQALSFTDRINQGKALDARVWKHLQFIRDREEFMVLSENQLYYWNPLRNKKVLLPLQAKDFLLFHGGLLYLDRQGKLFLRKKSFTPFEIQLVQIREKLENDDQK